MMTPQPEQELVGDVRAESVLSQWRIPFELGMVDLGKLTVENDSQVREESNRAPRAMVKEYALQMESGATFPPIIVDRQGWRLLDGNTRAKAAESIGRSRFPAYIVKCVDDDVRRGVAAALNQTGGKRLDETDAMRAAETLERRCTLVAPSQAFVPTGPTGVLPRRLCSQAWNPMSRRRCQSPCGASSRA
jgi:hypothetical protein